MGSITKAGYLVSILIIITGLFNTTISILNVPHKNSNYVEGCSSENIKFDTALMNIVVGLFIIGDGVISIIVFKHILYNDTYQESIFSIHLILFILVCAGSILGVKCIGLLGYINNIFTLPFIIYLMLAFNRHIIYYIYSNINNDYQEIKSIVDNNLEEMLLFT